MWALFFLLTAFAWAQPFGASKPIFPDDTQDPKQAGGAELLEAVCPGHVVVGEHIACKIVCPDVAAFKEESEWSLERVTRGHFLSPASDDAVLSMLGCELHAFNNGGTILLTRQSGGWAMLWYKGGVPTETCHRGKLQNGREIFICLGEYGGQGNIWTALYIEDFLAPSIALMSGSLDEAFVETFDNIATCGYNPEDEPKPYPLTRGYIERVQFQKAADGTIRGLSVFARHGARTMTPNQVKACMEPNHYSDFLPPTRAYRVDFKFDGKRMVRTGGSPGAPK